MPPSSTPILAVRDVTVRFGGIVALDGVSFDVERGTDRRAHRAQRRRQDDPLQLPEPALHAGPRRHRLPRPVHPRPVAPPHRASSASAAPSRTWRSSPRMTVLQNVMIGVHSRTRSDFLSNALRLPWVGARGGGDPRARPLELLAFLDLGRGGRPSGGRAAVRHAQARGAGARAGRRADAAARSTSRRAGSTTRRSAALAGSAATIRDAARGDDPPRRAPHGPRDAGLGPGGGARLRSEDRRGHAGRGPARSRRHPRLPRRGRAREARR